ncbi:MAG: prefoldin subunit alpha [Promethearchaeota archaeon]
MSNRNSANYNLNQNSNQDEIINNANTLIYVYNDLSKQLDYLNEQLAFIEDSQVGIQVTKSTIEELRKLNPDHELIIPIGNSAFIKVKLVDPDNYLISISKDLVVERTALQALDFIRKIEESQKKSHEILSTQIEKLKAKLKELQPQIEKLQDQLLQQGSIR